MAQRLSLDERASIGLMCNGPHQRRWQRCLICASLCGQSCEQPPFAPSPLIGVGTSSDTTTVPDGSSAPLQRICFAATPSPPIIWGDRGR